MASRSRPASRACRPARISTSAKSLSGWRVSTVDHRNDLLGEHRLDRVPEDLKGLPQKSGVGDLDGCRRYRIADIDVDPRRVAGTGDARRHGDPDPRVGIGVANHCGAESIRLEG